MSEELRPCPFCGTLPQANTWIFSGISETRYFCPNQECPLSVRAVTLERWNSRPVEDVLNKRIAELEAEIDQLTAHSDIERQDDKCSGHGDISNFPPVMGSGDGLGW